jgi:predicted transcriptional regulator
MMDTDDLIANLRTLARWARRERHYVIEQALRWLVRSLQARQARHLDRTLRARDAAAGVDTASIEDALARADALIERLRRS